MKEQPPANRRLFIANKVESEFLITDVRTGCDGYIDVVWKHMNQTVVAIEVDSSPYRIIIFGCVYMSLVLLSHLS